MDERGCLCCILDHVNTFLLNAAVYTLTGTQASYVGHMCLSCNVVVDMDIHALMKRKYINNLVQNFKKKKGDVLLGPKPKRAVLAPTDCKVAKVLVEEGMEVEKGQPLFVLNLLVPLGSILSERAKTNIKKYLYDRTGLSIYTMEDVSVYLDDPQYNPIEGLGTEDDFLKRYQNFKKFDTVVDHSDHQFSAQSSAIQQPSNDWANKIHEEWGILKKHLPDTIFVRVYEDRVDLLRAVIIGPQGTPYHDGLFFFDVCFPSNYPSSPPLVCSLSHVLGVDPKCGGKVPLFRKNTTDRLEITWVPGTSNLLQYLVSIRDLILNTNPFFNALPAMSRRATGESLSVLYNENILVKSLMTTVCTMMKPPMHFEVFVAGHFRERAHDILMACKSYKDGLHVGCLVSSNNQASSIWFKKDVGYCIELLVKAFNKIGAKEVESCPHLTKTKTPPPAYPHTPVVVGEDINVAVNKKRKVVVEQGTNNLGKKKTKKIDRHSPFTVTAPSAFMVLKVLVEEGAVVVKGQPLCNTGPWRQKGIISITATQSKSTIKKILERNRSSRVGIFSTGDTLLDENYSSQMEGLDNENDVLKR